MLRLAGCFGVVAGLFVATVAVAESTNEAVKMFGLIGTWSSDCAKDPREPSTGTGQRITYESPILGAPKHTVFSRLPNGETTTLHFEIASAVKVTEDKIKLRLNFVRWEASSPSATAPNPPVVDVVMQRAGSKIRTMERQSISTAVGTLTIENGEAILTNDGVEIHRFPTPLLEKCLN